MPAPFISQSRWRALEERLSAFERLLIVCGFAPPMQEVGCVGVVECHCVPFGCAVQSALFVDFGGLLVVGQNFLENGHPWGTGWYCRGCVLRWVYYFRFTADMIEWEWLGIFYLMDVFHVVYKVICASQPHIVLFKLRMRTQQVVVYINWTEIDDGVHKCSNLTLLHVTMYSTWSIIQRRRTCSTSSKKRFCVEKSRGKKITPLCSSLVSGIVRAKTEFDVP